VVKKRKEKRSLTIKGRKEEDRIVTRKSDLIWSFKKRDWQLRPISFSI